MARIKIDLPESYVFETQLKVRVTDLNYGGHLGNDAMVSLIHEARYQFFQSLGYADEISIEGIGTIQADLAVSYRSEAFHGDEIQIKIAVTEISKYSFDLFYSLRQLASEKEIARGKTTIVTFDYEQKKKCPIPDRLLKKLADRTT